MPRSAIRAFWRVVPGILLVLSLAGPGLAAPPTPPPLAPADRDWQVIQEQAAGPGNRFHDQAEALAAARQHLEKQESALRDFVRNYPADPHRYSARIRLASVLAARSRLLRQLPLREESQRVLTELENDPATPPPIRADAGFARVSQTMQDYTGRTDDATRDALTRTVRQYAASYPGDRRQAGLIDELATLYDEQPAQKKALLEEALGLTADAALRKRIIDNLKRLALLGHPIGGRLQPQRGAAIELGARSGRATVILFWASWSAPALRELAQLEQISSDFAGKPVDFLTVSLDENRDALAGAIEASGLRWPVHCDGKGWEGELVRSLGINALPTVWVLDKRGNLITLNARDHEAETIRRALE